ncbi:hypothetical protein H5410_021824 [Solanum commersonii]|uniref:Uncharacterized protein n=1 Tax=Solanum commersonii TaxID=4109 RepID=A0A9J5ZF25_SOLCO|nr:hypothetical protein H5410_021824 [Solanum commersonii]
MFKAFNVPLGEGITLNRNDIFTRFTLSDCRLLVEDNQVHDVHYVLLLSCTGEVSHVKDLPLQQQLDSNAHMDRVLQLLLPYPNPSKALICPLLNTLFQFLVELHQLKP